VETPQPTERKGNEQVGGNHPDMYEFLVSKNLDGELEAKSNGNEAQECQKKLAFARCVAKISASAINTHLKPKVNPRYFVTFAR
jgi:hypothetical protein